jgi:hypothetical protein
MREMMCGVHSFDGQLAVCVPVFAAGLGVQ